MAGQLPAEGLSANHCAQRLAEEFEVEDPHAVLEELKRSRRFAGRPRSARRDRRGIPS